MVAAGSITVAGMHVVCLVPWILSDYPSSARQATYISRGRKIA
jgi:hypothetical protein